MKNKLIIYIAGYGRSGSTVLEQKISNLISALSLGEFAILNKIFYTNKNLLCSCGKKYNICKLNKHFIEKTKKNNLNIWYGKILPQTNFLLRYPLLFFLKFKKIKNINLNNFNNIKKELQIIHKIFPDVILIDSSKTTLLTSNRPYVLKKLGYKVIIIHIYRSFFQTLKSVLSGTDNFKNNLIESEKKFKILRFIFGYFIANFSALLLSKNFQYIRLRNEELRKNEKLTLSKIKYFINKIIKEKKIKFKKTKENHLVAGNRLKKIKHK